jgi:outer membrane protein assembly factor BamA
MTRAIRAVATIVVLLAARDLASAQVSIKPVIGGLTADSGFAGGVELKWSGVYLKTLGSVKKYQFIETGYEAPALGRRWLSFEVSGRYRNFPEEDFWGLGPDTKQDQRTNFLYEDVGGSATMAVRFRKVRAGMTAGYVAINTGPGRDKNFPSVPENLQAGPRYRPVGPFVEYNSADESSDPHAGGKYAFRWTRYGTTFQRYEIDVRRFIPLTAAEDRIALRVKTTFTDTSTTQETPFFMLPTVGGVDTVRGFAQYRYRDRDALVLNGEYRRPVSGFLDAVFFADAGRVFSRASQITLKDAAAAAGVGTRVKFGSRMFFGVDLGFSREGTYLWFRSEHMF